MTPPKLRCAIYTRKSSEEGLEQGFNSLHAQREACEAYVLSQVGEGWTALKSVYDDGGFSGGSMDRPGLRALLADIDRGLIDVVVVYKVDRLTRSLADFAKIVEAFDTRSVSFVSVTQAFNTTTSMGRLTLNVLLSFAQFEREVTGERIRDKILASKKKGMWMGGIPPLGYDTPKGPTDRALIVNEAEAATVRMIFDKYLELQSVQSVRIWLTDSGIKSKAWTSSQGRAMGGLDFDRGALFHLLKNRTYIGEIPHKEVSYPGLHPGIIDPTLFATVGESLRSKAIRRRVGPTKVSTMLLRGKIYNASGEAMTPTFTHGARGVTYRYYVSAPLARSSDLPASNLVRRVPAGPIEQLVTKTIIALSGDGRGAPADVEKALARAEIHPTTLQLLLRRNAFFKRAGDPETEVELLRSRLAPDLRVSLDRDQEGVVRVSVPCRMQARGGRVWITGKRGEKGVCCTAPDPLLINRLRQAHRFVIEGSETPLGRVEEARMKAAPPGAYDRDLCRLAFLAPDIQALILEGRQPRAMTLVSVFRTPLPASWEAQRRLFGIPC